MAGRFFYVQVIWDDTLRALALDQWMREIPVVAERGEITDRNGTVLAGNRTSYAVFLRARAVEDAEYTATVLSEILECDRAELLSKINGGRVSEITVARPAGR